MANDDQQNIDFNVETSDATEYKKFIETLRRLFGRRSSHNRPVCVEQDQPTQWQDITLRTNSHSIVIRLRMGNLYMDGYRMENGEWLEFNNDNNSDIHLIPGSTFLGFTGHYQQLSRVADQEIDTVKIGQRSLVQAVNQLATTTVMRDRAWSLIVVIQMICESTRFVPISNHLSSITTYQNGATISLWMLILERAWGALSAFLLRADAYPDQRFQLSSRDRVKFPSNTYSPVGDIETMADIIAVLGILLGLCYRPDSSGRYPRAVTSDSSEQCLLGRPLVEIFSVVVNNIDGESPGQLYGTVSVTSGLHFQYIFDRTRVVPQSISAGEAAYLNGPSKSILAYDSVVIDVLLTDRDEWSPDDEVSKGKIIWDVYRPPNQYDKPISTEVKGKYGSVSVNYIVLSDAVAAHITITLKDGDGEKVAQVYGNIEARIGDLSGKDEKVVLFQQSKAEYEDVREGYIIPTRRSVVAVPTGSSLKVFACLYDHDTLSSDDEIANGTAVFPAQLSGTSIQKINGQNGNIEVAVVWNFDI